MALLKRLNSKMEDLK